MDLGEIESDILTAANGASNPSDVILRLSVPMLFVGTKHDALIPLRVDAFYRIFKRQAK